MSAGGRDVPPGAPAEAPPDAALAELLQRDPDLASWHRRYGPPPSFRRPPGFATLARIVLEQQVSLASASKLAARLAEAGADRPAGVLALGEAGLRALGTTRPKARYLHALAEREARGELRLDALAALPDAEVRSRLTALVGVGPWTAEVYLMTALGRPDAFPAGDLALQRAAAALRGRGGRLDAAALRAEAERWRPQRAAAARLLWHGYLAAATAGRAAGREAGRPVRG